MAQKQMSLDGTFSVRDLMPSWPDVEDVDERIAAVPVSQLTFPDTDHPRLDEPSMVELTSGRFLFAYANHSGRGDNDRSDVVAVELDRDARVIGEPRVIATAPPNGLNAMSPALRRLPDGRLGMLFSYRESVRVASRRFCWSDDEGRSWSEPVVVADGEYKTGCHDRFTIHSSGRLLAPCHCTDNWDGHHLHVRVSRSDDGGASWKLGESIELPGVRWTDGRAFTEDGCIEPGIAERGDGALVMTIRTAMGTQFKSVSHDAGETWTRPVSMEVSSSVAPCHISRIPQSDDLLIVWSPHFDPEENLFGRRTDVMTAVSTDGGRTFPYANRRVLIHDPVGTVSYPTVNYVGHEVWITLRMTDDGFMTQEGALTGVGLLRAPLRRLYGD
jgi:hypothetical protein